jgi:hypothetical protein
MLGGSPPAEEFLDVVFEEAETGGVGGEFGLDGVFDGRGLAEEFAVSEFHLAELFLGLLDGGAEDVGFVPEALHADVVFFGADGLGCFFEADTFGFPGIDLGEGFCGLLFFYF